MKIHSIKTAVFLFVFLFFHEVAAQFDLHRAHKQARSGQVKNKAQEIIRRGDAYWNVHERLQRHNGLKPYERWKYVWETYAETGRDFNRAILDFYEKQSLQARSPQTDDSNWQLVGNTEYTVTGGTEGKGRINAIAVDPSNPHTIYIGAPAGGLWKSTDGGNTWTPLTDQLPAPGVSAIAVDPSNSNIIYIGTGDDDALISPSLGVFKSTDGGQTWNQLGPNNLDFVSGIAINPNNTNIVIITTDAGIYRSTDGGQTWNPVQNGYFRELRMHPTNPQYVYAVSSDRFYRSTDGGATFQVVSNGLPSSSNVTRLVMDVTPAAPNKVYVLAINGDAFEGMYISSNKGQSFVRTNEYSDIVASQQGWYDLCLAVSDTDPDMIFYGELDVWRSTDGGNHFYQINQWHTMNASYTHADIHFMKFYNGKLYVGSDGGIYVSQDNGAHFTDLNDDLAISQHYKISVSNNLADQYIYGGLQDNGGIALNNQTWNIYHGADGMENATDLFDKSKAFSFIYFGLSLNITFDGGQSVAANVSGPEYGRWVTPLEMSPNNELFAGFSKVYKLVGNNWQTVTQTSFSSRIRQMKFHPLHANELYVAVAGELHKSVNGGTSFQLLHSFPNSINAIAINPDNNQLWVAAGENVYTSTDGGSTWSDISTGLPAGIAVRDLVYHRFSPDTRIYAATDVGVYRKIGNGNWEIFSNNLPKTLIFDLEINNKAGYLWAGTHGRSVWKTPIPSYDAQIDLAVYKTVPSNHFTCSPVSEVQFIVKNEGQNPVSTFDYTITIDGNTTNHTWNGNLAPGQQINIQVPFNPVLDFGSKTVRLETSLNGDQIITNDKSEVTVTVNKNEPGIFTYDLETSAHEMLTESASSLWQRGIPSGSQLNQAASGQYAYCTNPSGDYPNGATAYLYMPCLDLTNIQNPELKFEMAFDIEQDWDYFNVEYSTDNGLSWHILGTHNDPAWYNSNVTQGLCPGAQWTGTDTNIQTYGHELASLGSVNPLIRFVFKSDTYVTQEGVMLDNPRIEGQLSVENLQAYHLKLYPVPAGDFLVIENQNPGLRQITVTDMSGKKLYQNTQPASMQQIITRTWSPGTYIIHWHFDHQILHTKFLKN